MSSAIDASTRLRRAELARVAERARLLTQHEIPVQFDRDMLAIDGVHDAVSIAVCNYIMGHRMPRSHNSDWVRTQVASIARTVLRYTGPHGSAARIACDEPSVLVMWYSVAGGLLMLWKDHHKQ